MINTRLGRKPVLFCYIEEELVASCMMMERNFFGLTTKGIKRMTFELDIKMVLPPIFSTTRKSSLEVSE
jgi:hypothetical protein